MAISAFRLRHLLEALIQSSPHDSKQIFRPAFQRISHFGLVTSPIVHPSDACAVAAHVVQDRFHDMRQDAQLIGHHGCRSPTKIMHGPMGEGLSILVDHSPRCKNARIKGDLRFGPTGEPSMIIALSARTITKDAVAIIPPLR
ncbi:hypothetical protein [Bradyrhizobium niftali]|uniref:hypothetical protein n=1 Tax=Bradyrhizobium niftali TaxID=2560055 RepID=UPI001431192B|nr:hypothetical protein [Bradyrhizobium niftali]